MLAYYDGPGVRVIGATMYSSRPRWLCKENADPAILRATGSVKYDSLCDLCEKIRPESLALIRTYSLGDILMLMPVVRAMRRSLQIPTRVVVVIDDRFMAQIGASSRVDPDIRFTTKNNSNDYGCQVHFGLDSCLEIDHAGGEESYIHRVDLYARAMGMGCCSA